MASSDFEKLAEAQRETVRALAVLTEQLRSGGRRTELSQTPEEPTKSNGDSKNETRDVAGRGDAGAELGRALEGTTRILRDLNQVTSANTQALAGLSRELGGLPALLAGAIGGLKGGSGALGGVLKSGLGLVPLGLKIAGLFRGSREPEAAPLVPFADSPRLELEVGNTSNILAGFPLVDRGQRGEVRSVEQQRTVLMQPQVTVNVSAMDSRSFLDRSEDIARAVREAMLHMHPVNDLISEL